MSRFHNDKNLTEPSINGHTGYGQALEPKKEIKKEIVIKTKPIVDTSNYIFDWTDNHGHIFKNVDLSQWHGYFNNGEFSYDATHKLDYAGMSGWTEYLNRLKVSNWDMKKSFLMTYDKNYKLMNDADYIKDQKRLSKGILEEVGDDFAGAGKIVYNNVLKPVIKPFEKPFEDVFEKVKLFCIVGGIIYLIK